MYTGRGHKLDEPFAERFAGRNRYSELPNSVSAGSSDLQIAQSSAERFTEQKNSMKRSRTYWFVSRNASQSLTEYATTSASYALVAARYQLQSQQLSSPYLFVYFSLIQKVNSINAQRFLIL